MTNDIIHLQAIRPRFRVGAKQNGEYVRNGADMFTIITNDGWWKDTPSDIAISGDSIRVYNVHLASNWFEKEDYEFLDREEEN